MAKKRQLRERGSEEERKSQYLKQDVNELLESPNESDRGERPRWSLKGESLERLPPPNSCIPEEESAVLFRKCLGFSEFSSTKGFHVFGNQDGALPPKRKKRQYRQMLHVKGIYDIPLTKDQLENKS